MKTITHYKTIKITKESSKSLIKNIEKKGIYVSDWSKEIALKISTPKKEEIIELGMATVQELGFEKNPTTTELFDRIKSLGYELCPPMTGLHLRLNDYDQKVGWYYIAMEPIADSGGRPSVFSVERVVGGGRWLNTPWAYPRAQWSLDNRLVFRLRKETLNLDTRDLERNSDALPLELPHELIINGISYIKK